MGRAVITAICLLLAQGGCSFDRGGLPASSSSSPDVAGLLSFADGGTVDLLRPDRSASPDLPVLPDQGHHDLAVTEQGPPPCGPATCSGCCQGGQCLPGNQTAACGLGGASCQDCSPLAQLCTAGVCQGCVASDQCAGDTVCLKVPHDASSGSCEPAWNRKWHIQVVSAEINCKKDWEGSTSNPPDVYVRVTVGNNQLYSDKKYDTCNPVWNGFTEQTLTKSTKVAFTLWDYDSYNSDDWIGEVSYPSGLPIQALKDGEIDYQSSNSSDGLKRLQVLLWPLP